jgi:DNA-binding NtrC family response regulator
VSTTGTDNPRRIRQGDDGTANVLIVDDDPEVVHFMLELLARKGIRGHLAKDEKNALEFLDRGNCDVVFIREGIARPAAGQQGRVCSGTLTSDEPDEPRPLRAGGYELLRQIRTNWPELPVIMIGDPRLATQSGDNEGGKAKTKRQDRSSATAGELAELLRRWTQAAVRAVRNGCCDFLMKPLVAEKTEIMLDTLLPNHKVATAASAQEEAHCLYRIVGKSTKLVQTVDSAGRIAPTSAPVLIIGESGTGKELFSYLIHHRSKRAQGPYVRVNCAALSDSLLESELFGHEKGAFTGAYTQRKGRFETAHGGTLLLDEITETPARFQAKLLRVLEQQDFERVGGNENVRVDVRIVSTTNKNIVKEVEEGRFREDLYYRLSGIRLVIAPLKERKEDLEDLVWHFVNLYAREARRRITKLDAVMMDIFANYHWPGNVRQLRNVVRTALIFGVGETLSLADASWLVDGIPPYNNLQKCGSDELQAAAGVRDVNHPEQTREERPDDDFNCRHEHSGLGGVRLELIERRAILDTLRQTAGNRTKAAKVLGISDRTLRDKVRRYREQGCLQSAR